MKSVKKEVSFRRKLMTAVLSVTLPLIALLLFSTLYSTQAFNRKIADSNMRTMDYRAGRMEEQLDSVNDFLTGLTVSDDYRTLSGGEKKMASIATILAMTPDIILMDEPSIALDPKNRRTLIHILNDFEHLKIIASHDLDMILETCNRVILMAGGRIVCDGDTKEILTNKELLEANGLELPFCLQKPMW